MSGDDDHYFLTRIERYASQSSSGQGKTVAKLTYAVPATCGEEVPGLNVGVDGNPGAPYLASVENEDGTKLLFHYTLLPSTASPTGHECVLSGVQLQDAAGFQSAVDYQYEAQSAGLLSRATLGSDLDFGTQPHVESYAYTTSLGPGFSVYQDFGLQTEHPENAAGHATAAKGPYEEYSFNDPQTVADCGETDNASYCLPGGGLMTRTATNTRSMVGDGVLRAS